MSSSITNYDGAIVTTPQVLVKPKSVEELQEILRDTNKYPAPVRAMGSNHSLTPCAASTGTIIDMSGLKAIVKIDEQAMTLTAQAGLQIVEASRELRKKKLQFLLNIEIGNLTLGSAACCQTKDALDGVELGQLNSYVTSIKWVSPSGTLEEASSEQEPREAAAHPGQLRARRRRLRGDLQDQAARDRQVRLPRPQGGGADRRDHRHGDRVEPGHGDVDHRRRHGDSDPQRRDRAEARVAGQRAALRLELPRRLCRARTARTSERRHARAPRGSLADIEIGFYRC
jgi:hypothetical protein